MPSPNTWCPFTVMFCSRGSLVCMACNSSLQRATQLEQSQVYRHSVYRHSVYSHSVYTHSVYRHSGLIQWTPAMCGSQQCVDPAMCGSQQCVDPSNVWTPAMGGSSTVWTPVMCGSQQCVDPALCGPQHCVDPWTHRCSGSQVWRQQMSETNIVSYVCSIWVVP